MVWVAITNIGKTPLVFVKQGVKIDQYVYMEMLEDHLIPWAREHFDDADWCFQQDSAPGLNYTVWFSAGFFFKNTPHRIIHRLQIWRIRRPFISWNEIRALFIQPFLHFIGLVHVLKRILHFPLLDTVCHSVHYNVESLKCALTKA